ncbi:MAG TPA: cation diffusion facilitator family transporter [Thiomicrospira sp.]|jgi:cation diffusion facilitator family transporter|nr:cation diffusion facilitator family transporter [Thiomicrospira sp.]
MNVSTRNETEKKAIKLVMLGDVLMAIFGFVFFYLTNSYAILMDGVYPLIDLIAALLTLRVVSLMAFQANQKQPFGYAIFEPVLNFIKGIMILLVIVFAFYFAVEALLTGGRIIKADIAVYYSIFASLLGFVFSYFLYRLNQTAQSSLIDVDLKGWVIGSILSVAVGLSFGLAIWMKDHGNEVWLPYVDPIVILILIVFILPLPFQILKDNGLQIIGRSDNSELGNNLLQEAALVMDAIAYEDIKPRYLQIGRMVYLQVTVLLEAHSSISIEQQDDLRKKLYQQLIQKYDYLSLDVIYTADPIWINRGVGYKETK